MKSIFFTLLFTASSLAIFAQVDPRIIEVYGQERAAQLQSQQPKLIAYLNYYVANGFVIMENLPQEKVESALPIESLSPELSNVTLAELKASFNLLKYAYQRPDEHAAVFRIPNSNAVLALKPKAEIQLLFNEQSGGQQ